MGMLPFFRLLIATMATTLCINLPVSAQENVQILAGNRYQLVTIDTERRTAINDIITRAEAVCRQEPGEYTQVALLTDATRDPKGNDAFRVTLIFGCY